MLIIKNNDYAKWTENLENNWINFYHRLSPIRESVLRYTSADLFLEEKAAEERIKPFSSALEQRRGEWESAKAQVYASILEQNHEFFAAVSKVAKERGLTWGSWRDSDSNYLYICIGGFSWCVAHFEKQEEEIESMMDPIFASNLEAAQLAWNPYWTKLNGVQEKISARRVALEKALKDKEDNIENESIQNYNDMINYELLKKHFMFFAINNEWPDEEISESELDLKLNLPADFVFEYNPWYI